MKGQKNGDDDTGGVVVKLGRFEINVEKDPPELEITSEKFDFHLLMTERDIKLHAGQDVVDALGGALLSFAGRVWKYFVPNEIKPVIKRQRFYQTLEILYKANFDAISRREWLPIDFEIDGDIGSYTLKIGGREDYYEDKVALIHNGRAVLVKLFDYPRKPAVSFVGYALLYVHRPTPIHRGVAGVFRLYTDGERFVISTIDPKIVKAVGQPGELVIFDTVYSTALIVDLKTLHGREIDLDKLVTIPVLEPSVKLSKIILELTDVGV